MGVNWVGAVTRLVDVVSEKINENLELGFEGAEGYEYESELPQREVYEEPVEREYFTEESFDREPYDTEERSGFDFAGRSRSKKREDLNYSLRNMEDRKNDWLAKQLREEARILRSGDLSDLGAAHDQKCDAKAIKIEHHIKHLLKMD